MLLVVAVIIASVAFAALSRAMESFNAPTQMAYGFAASVFATVPFLHRRLARYRARSSAPAPIVPLREYAHPDSVVFVYAFCTALGTMALVGSVSFVLEYVESNDANSASLFSLSPLLSIGVPLYFLIGAWMGVRSSRHGVLIAAAVLIALTIVLEAYEVYVVLPPILEHFSVKPPRDLLPLTLKDLAVWSVPMAIGFWCGRKVRLPAYAAYVLRQLPRASREPLMELMADDAKSLRA